VLEPEWRKLESRSDGTFFTTWTWVGRWMAAQGEAQASRLQLLRLQHGGGTVGLGVVVPSTVRRLRLLRARAARMHHTGEPQDDDVTIEHNGLCLAREVAPGQALQAALHATLGAGGFDELRVSMASQVMADAAVPGWGRWQVRQPAYATDLQALRSRGLADPLEALGGATRTQIRRSLKRYAALGAVRLEAADSPGQALAWMDRLAALHQATWQARGQPGAFANPRFAAFHRALLASGHPRGEVQVLRVVAGAREVGYLQQFRHRNRVLAYQSGFDYHLVEGNHHPGLVVHALALRHAMDQGDRVYDFLAGEARYKRELGAQPYAMADCTWYRPTIARHAERVWRQVNAWAEARRARRISA
jgi:CelD/BcsL family acetyltransferase involved in cellulose biosynthesis